MDPRGCREAYSSLDKYKGVIERGIFLLVGCLDNIDAVGWLRTYLVVLLRCSRVVGLRRLGVGVGWGLGRGVKGFCFGMMMMMMMIFFL